MTKPAHSEISPPSAWVERFCERVDPAAEVLDLACGSGRHGRLFLARGHRLVLLDRDISRVRELGDERNVELIEADLEDGSPWPLGERQFGVVVVTNYLHRPLFPYIVAAVAPGGWLLYETFALGNEKFGKPSNPDFLLAPGELRRVTSEEFEIIAFEEGQVDTPRPAVVQRAAVRRV